MKFIVLVVVSLSVFLEHHNYANIKTNNYQHHGTLVIAIICYDGIIIAADSRGSFTEKMPDGKEHAFAYIDSIQKIFFMKKYPVAITGVTMISKKYYSQLLKEFSQSHIDDASNFQKTFINFKAFLSKKYSVSDSMLFEDNAFISGFYENQTAKLAAFTKDDSLVVSVHNGMIFSALAAQKTFFELYDSYKLPLTCENGAFLAEKAIYKFALDSNKTSEVGGPLTIIKISPNNTITSMKSFIPKKYKDYKDFANSIFNNETKIIYTDPLGRQKVGYAINNVLKAWY